MFEYRAKVKRIVDGDTVDFEVDLGFNVNINIRSRLLGVNTPERGHKDFYKNTISGFANADVILFIIDSIQNWSEQSEQHFQSLTSLNKKNFILS